MNDKTEPLSTVAVDPLVMRLRAMARFEHDDFSIGDEAADRIEQLEQRIRTMTTGETMYCCTRKSACPHNA